MNVLSNQYLFLTVVDTGFCGSWVLEERPSIQEEGELLCTGTVRVHRIVSHHANELMVL